MLPRVDGSAVIVAAMWTSTVRIAQLVAELARAPDDAAWRDAFRRGFAGLRAGLQLHPAGSTAAETFAGAAATARDLSVVCLPLGIAVVMHLYPLCALRCVPIPWWRQGGFRRQRLLRRISNGALILSNAGSDRTTGAHAPVMLTRTHDGIRVNGTYDYVSLANVADLVLFSAPLADSGRKVFCAADLRSGSVCIGGGKFGGSMRLSDTCPVTFDNHRVAPECFIEVPNEPALNCMAQYQRSWFHLLLGEGYLSRIEHLRRQWGLARPVEQVASLNELAHLREYALRLLDGTTTPDNLESLSRVTAAIKLRISLHAQSTAAAIRSLDEAAAAELGFLGRQPTSDERILRSLGAAA
jgi:alkylation response protein AidB-like acyl-CoA dehydrogenase